MHATPFATRRFLAILAVAVGLFMVAAVPFIIQTSLERVLTALLEVVETKPAYASGILLFSFAYPLYRAFIFIAGITLILVAMPLARGEDWTYAVALLAAAFPSAGGMFMFLPYVSFVDGFPLPLIISFVGLTFFWSLILVRQADKWLKWGHFLALTFAGMLTTHTFTLGIGNLRMLLTRPTKPLFDGIAWWVLAWSAPIQWLAVILLFCAIYLLAARRPAGWWLALIAAVSILAIDIPTQIIRTTLTDATSLDYLYGALLALGLLIPLLYPPFRRALLDLPAPAPSPVPAESQPAAAD
jgi:hypothetical protein